MFWFNLDGLEITSFVSEGARELTSDLFILFIFERGLIDDEQLRVHDTLEEKLHEGFDAYAFRQYDTHFEWSVTGNAVEAYIDPTFPEGTVESDEGERLTEFPAVLTRGERITSVEFHGPSPGLSAFLQRLVLSICALVPVTAVVLHVGDINHHEYGIEAMEDDDTDVLSSVTEEEE